MIATELGLQSLTAALLHSRGAADLREILLSWTRPDQRLSPPAVSEARRGLDVVPAVGKVGFVMTLLSTALAGVALASAGPAIRGAASIMQAGAAHEVADASAPSGGRAPARSPFPSHPRRGQNAVGNAGPAEPTFAALCGPAGPGEGAPQPQADELRSLWLGSQSGPGTGAIVAGCPEAAMPVRPGSGTWFAAGRCAGELRSVGVSTGDQSPALALSASRAVSRSRGRPTEPSSMPRDESVLDRGDAYVLDTTIGAYVLVRPGVTTGVAGTAPGTSSCAEAVGASAPYTVVPPALIEAWHAVVQRSWAWPTADVAGRSFTFRDASHRAIVATATCSSDDQCRMTSGGRVHIGGRGGRRTAEEILARAPRPLR